MRHHQPASFGHFRCANCRAIVSNLHMFSAVNNRNHCPHCLWSCHLDLYSAGDRLSACKAGMRPIGLAFKRGRNKYQLEPRGELMLIHTCMGCGAISINRIAADDDPETVLSVFESSHPESHGSLHGQRDIRMLTAADTEAVFSQLYGLKAEVSNV